MLYTVKNEEAIKEIRLGATPEELLNAGGDSEIAEILDYPWLDQFPYHFRAWARVTLGDKGLNVLMISEESPILSKETRFGGMPCMDSCLEFFLMPFPKDNGDYINIEINPMGAAHVGIGAGRHGRRVYKEKIEGLDICTFTGNGLWGVSYTIPNALFIENYGKAPARGDKMKGNFYKCSGNEMHEHYGCWNHVTAPKPDFHRPECFGDIVIE